MSVSEMDDKQLREEAKRLEVKCPPRIGEEARKKVEEDIKVAQYKKELELKDRAKAERKKDVERLLSLDPATKAKPSPETIAISNSKKVYAVYYNQTVDERTDIEFNKGCTHTFHLYDEYIHILPQCLIDEANDPESPTGKTPIHGTRKDSTPGVIGERSVIIGHKKRFRYEVLGDAPQEAKFGVVLDKAIYKKLNHPFPQAA